jgi:hypothetical protein
MRIKTSKVLRKIDEVKESIASQNARFFRGFYCVMAMSTSSLGKRALGAPFLILFIVPLAIQFAALQFAFLVLLGFFSFSLLTYRFANRFLRVMLA